MTTAVAVGTPLAEALGNVIQPKLVEMGWSSEGGDDSALTEYVILMLVNGKSQEQIAGELSNDLLGLDEGDTQALDFSRWLFDQVEIVKRQINGEDVQAPNEPATAQAIPSFTDMETATVGAGGQDGEQDAEMGDSGIANDGIPTGPKALRNARHGGRGRMLNQINRTMNRGDAALHRVRGQAGAGRMNSRGRDYNKGNRFQNGGGRMFGTGPVGGMGMHGNQMGGAAGNVMSMNPQDQMRLMSLLEEQARVMAQCMPGMVPPAVNPSFQQNGPRSGRSLMDRVERKGPTPHGAFSNRPQQRGISAQGFSGGQSDSMDTNPDTGDGDQDESNTNTACRFNLRCTRKDCPFAHQSPAAPEGSPIDVNDVCTFGAACKNRKCTARHPSPAVKTAHHAEEVCRFFPNCTNPHCSFRHPTMPLCRHGADCSVDGCKFTHLQVPCKFHPCLNRSCPYKHAEGQKGAFPDKVWVAESGNDKEKPHVSERKFVSEEGAEEELIKPEAMTEGSQGQELAT